MLPTPPAPPPMAPHSAIGAASYDLQVLIDTAHMFGLKGNVALLSANRAVNKLHNINLLETLGSTHLLQEEQSRPLTVTELGSILGVGTAQMMNLVLAEYKYQTCRKDHKNRNVWETTAKGEEFGRLYDTDKKNGIGTTITQLKWLSTIIPVLKAEMAKGSKT
jgi:hypothetical protein